MANRSRFETEKACTGRGGAKYAESSRGMKAVQIMTRIDRVTQPAGNLDARDVRSQKGRPAFASSFSQRHCCGEHGRGGMGLLARRARRQSCKLRVVVVQHVALHPIDQGGVLGGKSSTASQNRRAAGRFSQAELAAQKPARRFDRAAEHGCQAIEQVNLGRVAYFGWN